jgi:TonB-linked SusC/RagA family outer membrane protein
MRKLLTASAAVLLFSLQLFAQKIITGKVTDDKGLPVANASVLIKGTNTGTVTKTDGSFSLTLTANAKTLIFSSVDMAEQEVNIGSQSVINASLKAANKSLQEVVVVAYGTQKKTNVTGAAATVKGDDLENRPFTSPDKALQGAIPGLLASSSSGAPGSTTDIRIRGISSINASNAPLWVIDGAIINTGDASRLTTTANLLSTLNPNDIENITVLKDAASTSIYGSRGANGVILVTTKKGRAGKTKFRFDTEMGQNTTAFTNPRNRSLNAQEYIDLTREGLVNQGASAATITATLTSLGNGNGNDFNWLNAVTRTGSQSQYNLSASGGSDKTTFYLSGGYFKQEGTVIASDLKKYNGAIRVTNQATDKLSLNVNLDGGFVTQNTPLAGGAFGNPVLSAFFILPTFSAYKPDGTLNYLTADFPTSSLYNTVAVVKLDKRKLRQFSLRGNLSAEYKILSNLTFKTSYGSDFNYLEEEQYNNPFYGDGAVLAAGSPTFGPNVQYNSATTGRAFAFGTRYYNYTWTNILSLKQNINKQGNIYSDIKLGYESQRSSGYFSSLQGRGFPLTLDLQYPASTATPTTASATITQNTFASVFSIADINVKDRYILSGSFRRDGSSKFGTNNKYGNFWSVGASWNVSNENFMKNIDFITSLKLRGSYGVVGNAGIGDYDYFPGYGYGTNYNSTPGSAPNNVGNLDLTWELNKPLDFGIDISILKNRISLTADVYKRKSEELLLDVPLSPTSGFLSVRKNVGTLENKGVELALNVVPIKTKDFTWSIDFNYARNKNKVTSLPNGDIANGLFQIRVGYDIQAYYLREYAGVDPANGDPLWFTDSTHKATQNVYSTAKRTSVGSASPKYFGSLTNSFTFKGFSLEAQFYYSYGNYTFDAFNSFYIGAGANPTFNKVARILDRWQKPGDKTDIPKYIYGGNKSFQSSSTFYLNRADYIRLRNLQIGYTVAQSVLSKFKISSAIFYVRGTNLWTKAEDKNLPFDPEQGAASRSNLNVFIPKTIAVGLNIGF